VGTKCNFFGFARLRRNNGSNAGDDGHFLRPQEIGRACGPKLANWLNADVVCNEIADLLLNKMKEAASNHSLRVNHAAATREFYRQHVVKL